MLLPTPRAHVPKELAVRWNEERRARELIMVSLIISSHHLLIHKGASGGQKECGWPAGGMDDY